eukprot:TRINITY_DN12919_c0_g1_i1.p1 TRINITY_DN12919_c0_g1~~TRINITY_DN12919_c0_g1_i1.p1  ORF type:complete len:549 (+),score=98.18 TRINITY_DN12919_c0_g1_i1:182-1648(+)
MDQLNSLGYTAALREYIASGKPYFGICLGMQTLFEGSEESPGTPGLGVIKGLIQRLHAGGLAVPHIGWNEVRRQRESALLPNTDEQAEGERFYFVHSYCAPLTAPGIAEWALATTDYGQRFVSAVHRGNVAATQFHPEKSGEAGLALLRRFLEGELSSTAGAADLEKGKPTVLARRIIACLDVRSNDNGDLVVTKGDQYDVREKEGAGDVRNLGKPVDLAHQYYAEGADEVTFLNITSFRDVPLRDLPMLEVLRRASERVFVPLTIGGGIRDVTDPDGKVYPALEVAAEYFRSGADKVSIGSDAVFAVEEFLRDGEKKTGRTAIEQIARVYGSQAVVISVDPKRVYVARPEDTPHRTIRTKHPGPQGEEYVWYQCSVKGGREFRDLGVYEFVRACEALGAGEILLNCIDRDGTNSGYDLELVALVKEAVGIPVIASSGAGKPEHFAEVLLEAKADAALAAGIFHRKEVPIAEVKQFLRAHPAHVPVRI